MLDVVRGKHAGQQVHAGACDYYQHCQYLCHVVTWLTGDDGCAIFADSLVDKHDFEHSLQDTVSLTGAAAGDGYY